jgi:HK97 family phage major capsid protein
MPDIGANAFPVAFGDFGEGYLIVDLVGLRITVDDNITTPGQVKFYLRKRVGGKLLNDDAIKVIKCAAS